MRVLTIILLTLGLMATVAGGQTGGEETRRTAPPKTLPKAARDEPGSTVPFLTDLPVLGHLFQRHGSRWVPLPGLRDFSAPGLRPRTGDAPDEERLPFRERWLMARLKLKVPDLQRIDVIEMRTIRWKEDGRKVSTERGCELGGPGPALTRALALIDSHVRLQETTQFVCEFHIIQRAVGKQARKSDGGSARAVNPAEYEAILRRTSREEGAQVLGAPSLIINHCQLGNVSITNQIAYIRDFAVETALGAAVADPVIDNIREGYVVQIAVMRDPDSGILHVESSASIGNLKRPIEEVTTTILGDQKVTVHLPQVTYSTWETDSLTISPGQVGFHATGMTSTTDVDGEVAQRSVEILCRLKLLEDTDLARSAIGQVIGIDREARRVFCRIDDLPPGRTKLEVVGGGRRLAQLKILQSSGGLVVAELLGGDAKAGDSIH